MNLKNTKEDTMKNISEETSNITINTEEEGSLIFQLLQNEKIAYTFLCDSAEYILEGVVPGEYILKCIFDKNQDKKWTTGNWEEKTLPEKTINYSNKLTIRANWDVELDWDLD